MPAARDHCTGDPHDLKAGVAAYRSASDIRKRAPVEILHAAAEWSEWALERRAWEEAAESGLLGLAASNRAAVHELGPGPAARFDVTPQLDQLVVAGLLGGASGTKDRRPALDALMKDAKRRRFDVLVVWRLDRLGRNLKHLVTLLEDVQAVGIAFVSLGEGIDCTTAAGRLQLHVLAALAEFERARIAERVRAGLARVRASGKRLGRPATDVAIDRPSADGSLVRPRRGRRPRRVALRRASGQAVPKTCRIDVLISSGIRRFRAEAPASRNHVFVRQAARAEPRQFRSSPSLLASGEPVGSAERQTTTNRSPAASPYGSEKCGALGISGAHDAERHIPRFRSGNNRGCVVGYVRRRCLPIAGKAGCERTVDGRPGGQ